MTKSAILLVNLGSPDSPSVSDVRRYLREFLGDERVLDLPKPLRVLLLEGVILRTRPKASAHAYAGIWTPEGSPLLSISERVRHGLTARMGATVSVHLAMRYGRPSIADVVTRLKAEGIKQVLIFPQYAHYAMSSWETVVVKASEELQRQAPEIAVEVVQPFYRDPDYIEALYDVAKPYLSAPHDHLLFSYHGLPVRHLRKADSSHGHCLKTPDCCSRCSPAHATCYKAQVLATTAALAARAGLSPSSYSTAFQSRLAGEPWLEPATDATLAAMPSRGIRQLLVICPAFVADCLETLEEIAVEGRKTFIEAGGVAFQQIPCLNDHPAYLTFLEGRARRWLESSACWLSGGSKQTYVVH